MKGIKTLAGAAAYDPKQFASHSLRRGGATLAFRMGAPVQQIQLQGDWLSDAVYRYQQVHLANRLATTHSDGRDGRHSWLVVWGSRAG